MFKTSLKVCNRIQAKKAIQIHHIFLTDVDYDYILDEIKRRDKIYFESTVSGNSDEK